MPGYRCILGCKQTGSAVHVFPNPNICPERFKLWVNIVGGKLETPSDFEYYKKKRICDIHFKEEHKTRYNRLSAIAVPCLYLPDKLLTPCLETAAQPGPSASARDLSDKLRRPCLETADQSGPSAGARDSRDSSDKLMTPSLETAAQSGPSAGARDLLDVNRKSCVLPEQNCSVISKHQQKPVKKVVLMGYGERLNQMKIKKLQSEICRLRKKNTSFKQRLANANKLSTNIQFETLVKNMKKPAQLFISMQRQVKNKAKGRRFSIDEKILCLSLFKKSPKCYKMMAKYFTLPSSRAMKRLLSLIKIHEGINKIVFEKIKQAIHDRDISDRLVTVIFDEMSITPQIFYNVTEDKFTGFAQNKETSFTDHALVFMVKGVKSGFKQPVAYYFTNSLKKVELKQMIKTVLKEVMKAGLIVVATICDQSAVNVGAISELVDETKSNYLRRGEQCNEDIICLFGKKIVPLFDPPHLIKGIRNNLLDKDLVYTINNEKKTVRWEFFQDIYDADRSEGELKILYKLTEEHINKEKINKMRVKSATQLFSHSVAVATKNLVARGLVREICSQLIDIVLLIDNIFDSLNGSTFHVPNGKIYKGPCKRNSPHHELWIKAVEILKTIKFVKTKHLPNKVVLTETVTPSIKNLIKTIKGMQSIWQILNRKYNVDTVLTRNFNQDPLENFFGSIRSYGARNIAPNTVCFEGAYKSLMVNNMNSPHSKSANCEEDSYYCLQNLDFYLREKIQDAPEASDAPEDFRINFEAEICSGQPNENDAGQSNYVCGWVVRKCLKNIVKNCENCRFSLLQNNKEEKNAYLSAKEYQNKRWLCYPSEEIHSYFKSVQNITCSILKKDVPKKHVKKCIILYQDLLEDCPFKCINHKIELKRYFLDNTLNVLLNSWARSVNRILCGKLTYHGEDEVKTAAQVYHNKFKHYKNRK